MEEEERGNTNYYLRSEIREEILPNLIHMLLTILEQTLWQ